MKLGIQGTQNFKDYAVFLRAMRVILSDMDDSDKEITIFSAGPAGLNSMSLEFSNKTEDSLKARGIKIKTVKVPVSWFMSNMSELNYFAYFSLPKESVTPLIREADDHDVENGIFRY